MSKIKSFTGNNDQRVFNELRYFDKKSKYSISPLFYSHGRRPIASRNNRELNIVDETGVIFLYFKRIKYLYQPTINFLTIIIISHEMCDV